MNLSGNPIDFLYAFFGGILISFTPCIYPLIPVTLGYIGTRGAGSRRKGFLLGFSYISGIAVTYSVLGIIASVTGTLFGRISSHPLAQIFVGLVIFLLGLSMLDLFSLPQAVRIKIPKFKKQNLLAAFLLGLVCGLAVSPCLSPVLASILVYLAAKQNFLYGAGLLLSFAYGMGVVLILAASFASILVNLPRAGRWSVYIKKAFAFIMLVMGTYFIAKAF